MPFEDLPRAVTFDEGRLLLLDQRKLPLVEEILECRDVDDVFEAIKTLTVRGAPAIGIAAAYGLLLGLQDVSPDTVFDELERRCDYLISARPTAVNLAWAVNRMRASLDRNQVMDANSVYDHLLAEAVAIHEDGSTAAFVPARRD